VLVVVIAAIGALGIQTASLVAIIGAAGLAIRLALQGSLANFVAGVLMIIFRPYKLGDLVQVADTVGFVEEVDVFTTTLRLCTVHRHIGAVRRIRGTFVAQISQTLLKGRAVHERNTDCRLRKNHESTY